MKKQTKNNVISLRLNEKEYRHLTEIADRNKTTLSKAVRYAITATYLSSINEDEKVKETNYIIDGIFKSVEYQENKIEYLERILHSQKIEIEKHIKELEKMDKETLKILRNQMTISNVSD